MYFYTVPETGHFIEHPNFYTLLAQLRKYYQANSLEEPLNLGDLVQDHMCHKLPESFCKGHSNLVRDVLLSPFKVREFTRALFRMAVAGEKSFCTTEEAQRRAKVCESCPSNIKSYCTNCNQLGALTHQLVRGRKLPQDWDLGVCKHCSCLLKVKVHLSEAILKDTPDRGYPEACWLNPFITKKQNPTHTGELYDS